MGVDEVLPTSVFGLVYSSTQIKYSSLRSSSNSAGPVSVQIKTDKDDK